MYLDTIIQVGRGGQRLVENQEARSRRSNEEEDRSRVTVLRSPPRGTRSRLTAHATCTWLMGRRPPTATFHTLALCTRLSPPRGARAARLHPSQWHRMRMSYAWKLMMAACPQSESLPFSRPFVSPAFATVDSTAAYTLQPYSCTRYAQTRNARPHAPYQFDTCTSARGCTSRLHGPDAEPWSRS